jgi:serine/threonine protein kinase
MEFMATSYFTSVFSGTARWMAPELLAVPEEEEEEVTNMIPTPQSDIYSFGCIMFQVRTTFITLHSPYLTLEAGIDRQNSVLRV